MALSIIEESKRWSSQCCEELRCEVGRCVKDSGLADGICVFMCGSLGRMEAKQPTDLDLFFIGDGISRLSQMSFFSRLLDVNRQFNFSDPCNDGEFWKCTERADLLHIGSREEDSKNGFTARMLLILESKPLYNEASYNGLIDAIVDEYFRDYEDHKEEFRPSFLINDIRRYWYTLTVNFEDRRTRHPDSEQDSGIEARDRRYWNRLKIKYPRLLTCFSMQACLLQRNIGFEDVKEYIRMTPLERVTYLKSEIPETAQSVDEIVAGYEWFLKLKNEQGCGWWDGKTDGKNNKDYAFENAAKFKRAVLSMMYVLASENPDLAQEADLVLMRA